MVVAGAAGSLGKKLATRYAAAGRKLLSLDQNAGEREPSASHAEVVSWAVDLADAAAVEKVLAENIPRSDSIRLLVNAVGLIWNEPVLTMRAGRFIAHDVASWDKVLRANLTTTFVTSSRVAARMARTGGGCIVNFSSISARGNPGQVAYAAAKAGVEGLTRAMAQELGPMGIRVNAIAPGFIDVASTRAALSESLVADYVQRTPMRRLGTLDELALAIEALERNEFMTGTVIELDGGLRL